MRATGGAWVAPSGQHASRDIVTGVSDLNATRAFLESEVEGLEPFGFVAVAPGGNPQRIVEIQRRGDAALEVRIPGSPLLLPELPVPVRSKLREHGFHSEAPDDRKQPWTCPVESVAAAVALLQQVLIEVFEEKPDVALDVAHGNHRAEVEARQKLAETRDVIEESLAAMADGSVEKDDDGDYVVSVGDVHVTVAPRAMIDGTVVVRVFAITNVGVTVAPDLGLFLARLNFSLMLGRFALDAEHASIWFDESLLGVPLDGAQLRFTVNIVASTADEWDDRLAQMFGGVTYQDVLEKRAAGVAPPVKPGQGGYL